MSDRPLEKGVWPIRAPLADFVLGVCISAGGAERCRQRCLGIQARRAVAMSVLCAVQRGYCTTQMVAPAPSGSLVRGWQSPACGARRAQSKQVRARMCRSHRCRDHAAACAAWAVHRMRTTLRRASGGQRRKNAYGAVASGEWDAAVSARRGRRRPTHSTFASSGTCSIGES